MLYVFVKFHHAKQQGTCVFFHNLSGQTTISEISIKHHLKWYKGQFYSLQKILPLLSHNIICLSYLYKCTPRVLQRRMIRHVCSRAATLPTTKKYWKCLISIMTMNYSWYDFLKKLSKRRKMFELYMEVMCGVGSHGILSLVLADLGYQIMPKSNLRLLNEKVRGGEEKVKVASLSP